MKFLIALTFFCAILGIHCYDQNVYRPFTKKYRNFDFNIVNPDQGEFKDGQNTVLEILTNVLKSCDDSFNLAERRINLALNQIESYDGKSTLIEEFLSNLGHEESFWTPFVWKMLSPNNSNEEFRSNYRSDLINLLLMVKEACLTLPSAIPHKTIFELSKGEIVNSLLNWSRKWFFTIQEQMVIFIEKCNLSFKCSKLLTEVLNLSIFIVEKEELSDINEALDGIMNLLQSETYAGQTLRDFVDLWYKHFDSGGKEVDPFWLSQGLLIKEGHIQNSQLGKGQFGTNKGDLEIDTEIVVHELPKEFLSFAFGSRLIQENFRDLPEKRTRLFNLACGLLPSYIRIGGSAANFLTYDATYVDRKFPKIKGWSYESWRRNSLHPKLSNNLECQVEPCEKQLEKGLSNFTMTGHQWKFIVDLVKDLKTVLLFDLNQFMRDDSGFWDPTNARLIMQDESTKQIPVIWQLGNEPNSYNFEFGWMITPEQTAIDYINLKTELDNTYPNRTHFIVGPDVTSPKKCTEKKPKYLVDPTEPNSYNHKFGWTIYPEKAAMDFKILKKELDNIHSSKKHFIVGPDVTQPRKFKDTECLHNSDYDEGILEQNSIKFLSIFLQHAGHVVDAVSWHHYYMNGLTANLSEFTSIENMDRFVKELNCVINERDEWAPKKPIWLTETANASGGGSRTLSLSFAATFLWLDKLGAAAFGGVSMVYRQTLYGGKYGLLDKKLRPIPNYWVSVLHKQLIGQKVLLPRVRLAPKGLRIYAHCMNKENGLYEEGAAVVFGMNVGDNVTSVGLSNIAQYNSTVYAFRLSAPLGELRSQVALLNGEILEVSKSGKVPVLTGQEVQSGQLGFHPKTIVFYALPQANIPFC